VGQALTGAIEIAQERLEQDAGALSPAAESAAAGLSGTVDPASFPRVLESARGLAPAGTALLFFEKDAEVARDGEVPAAVRGEILTRIKAIKGDGDGKGTLIGDGFAAAWRRATGGVIVVAVRTLSPPRRPAYAKSPGRTTSTTRCGSWTIPSGPATSAS